jgi:hypothetical protein
MKVKKKKEKASLEFRPAGLLGHSRTRPSSVAAREGRPARRGINLSRSFSSTARIDSENIKTANPNPQHPFLPHHEPPPPSLCVPPLPLRRSSSSSPAAAAAAALAGWVMEVWAYGELGILGRQRRISV